MSKKLFIVILIVIGLVVATVTYLGFSRSASRGETAVQLREGEQPTTVTPETPAQPGAAPAVDTSMPTGTGYKTYSAEAVAQADGTKILFFHASWCSQCQLLDKDIKASKIPDGVSIFKVDYDTNQELRKQYGVTIQTTLVKLDASGKELKKFIAYDEPTLAAVVRQLAD